MHSVYGFAFLVLLIIYISIRLEKYGSHPGIHYFKLLVLLNMAVLLMDPLTMLLMHQGDGWTHWLLQGLTFLIYAAPTLLVIVWFAYVYSVTHGKKPSLNKKHAILLLPALLDLTLSFLSMFFDIYFIIDHTNGYARGPLYLLTVTIQYGYFISASIMILTHMKKMKKAWIYPLIIFAFVPMVAGLIQIMNYGFLIVYPALALSLVMVFVFVIFMNESKIDAQKKDAITGFRSSQIKQHFIHNTLNTILSLSYDDIDSARALLLDFSHYLRERMQLETTRQMVALEKEIEITKAYVRIQKKRFSDHFDIEFDIAIDRPMIKVPVFIVQPLIENALKHGILKKEAKGKIVVRIRENRESVLFSIRDDGPGFTHTIRDQNGRFKETQGIGLRNVESRLYQLYQEHLKICSLLNVGTIVRFRIPKQNPSH